MKPCLSLGAFAFFLFIFLGFNSCTQQGGSAEATAAAVDTVAAPTQEDLVKRGAYLVSIMGCHDCHTPKKMGPQGPEPDMSRMLSGHPADATLPAIVKEAVGPDKWVLFSNDLTAAVGPWGVSFSANISSDDTGIGLWTEEQFFRAIKEGKFMGMENGRPIMPPMPWQALAASITDEDLRAIFAYLKTTPPTKNVVPAYIPADKM